jgi:ATP-binding cassette subfamily B protein
VRNVGCTIEPGQKVGLVGESGAGKTTFINLLLRTYDIQDGEITIDGQNIAQVTQDSLHQNIGVIPQDPSLFHRTLFENIHYGAPEKNSELVYEAAKLASAHDFIVNTENKYGTLVGERGIKLSGGQRQRIVIARAFLKNAPILILDEATSALDSMTEREIQSALWKLMQGKTCIVVAHRLSTLIDMDRILVFDEGKIVQDGTHADLCKQEGIYKNLWNTQMNKFNTI